MTKLIQRREELGLTQFDIASAIGIRDQSVSNWERGIHTPRLTVPQTKKLCEVLQVDLDGLLEIIRIEE